MIDFHCDNCEFLQDKSNDNIIDGYCKKYNQSLTFYDWFEKCDKCLIETLQSENAALRERLSRAVELPCIKKSLRWAWSLVSGDSVLVENYLVLYMDKDGYVFYDEENSREAAEARLAELKGGKE